LYVLGNKKILNNKGIAIVGTRDCTKYGKNISFKFSKELTQKGFNIISGLALGIDTYAHLGNVQINMENSKSIGKSKFRRKITQLKHIWLLYCKQIMEVLI
jgi:predicted Rossmann fold nucleotide-binding protein DprA/Smf involved in DNA uptake